ncbi:hypothetical protein [Absidia glauca]|uniref:EF-hand domain-containing protein n=1 Tax=Absidia glauca TaxID=4829 RepID=A0A168TAA5_ABSGL|nr:hypothetical protein [Absidia glauca]
MAYQSNQYGGYHQSPPPPQQQSAYSSPQNRYNPPPQGTPYQNYGRPPPPPPSAADAQLWSWFTAVDTDKSGQLTVDELQRALVNGDWSPFNIETVHNTGTIDFQEFAGLWKYIEDWKRCFQTFDVDHSGSIDRAEMKNALRTFGYNLSDRFVTVLIQKFDKYGGQGNVTFDNFVQACVNVKTLTDSFRSFDTDNDGWIQINYEQFLELVIRQKA